MIKNPDNKPKNMILVPEDKRQIIPRKYNLNINAQGQDYIRIVLSAKGMKVSEQIKTKLLIISEKTKLEELLVFQIHCQ